MKTSSFSLLHSLLFALAGMFCLCPVPRLVADAAVPSDWDTLQAIIKERPPANPPADWLFVHQAKVREGALHYFEAHPTDPVRWQAALIYIQARQFPGEDHAGLEAYDRKNAELFAAFKTAIDVPAQQKEYAAGWSLILACWAAKDDADYQALGRQFDAFVAEYPKGEGLDQLAGGYFEALSRQGAGVLDAAAERYATSAAPAVAKMAKDTQERALALKEAGKLKFTAVDGREVDLGRMRGKVVLIDFWATWCGPCKAEIPTVVAAYRKYHDQGFEVVGVSFESANIRPTDKPEEQVAKLAKAKEALAQFTQEHEMPWPQYYDGKWWANSLAAPFKVRAIPFMLLLDKSGQVVSTNARGPALEEALRKYLTQ